jgi:hypothetical protein
MRPVGKRSIMQTRFHPRHSSEQHLYLFAVGQIPTGRRRSRFSHANHIRRRKYLHISLRALKTRQRAPKHIYGVNQSPLTFLFLSEVRARLIASSWCVPRYAFVISTLRTIFAAGNEEYPIS